MALHTTSTHLHSLLHIPLMCLLSGSLAAARSALQ